MDSKKILKGLGRFIGWLMLVVCSLITRVLPMRYVYAFARGLASLGYRVAGKHRRVALESLGIAFGQGNSASQNQKIARDCFTSMAKSGVEVIFLTSKPPRLLDERIRIVDSRVLDKALAKGKGVILVSAHFGNFPLMVAKLGLAGYKISAIMRHMRDKRAEKMFLARRDVFRVKTIYSQPRDICVNSAIDALRNNELVFIPLDQNFGTGGVFVDFFGSKAATATGPVILARRTGAAILPCFIIRQPDDTHKIVFEPPMELEKGPTPKETVVINVQKLTHIIESYIRRYPAEWSWIHRRWKTRMQS
jgi:Kdo2-lipid IVA lauroyltransferase/acyltransferase